MPFSTFTELSKSIGLWTKRGTSLDLLIPDFIKLAEDEMYNPAKIPGRVVTPLKLKQLEKTSTAPTTTTSRFIALPDDYASMRGIRLDINNESDFLQYRAPQQLIRFDDTGRPCFFTIIGTQIEFDRVPDEVLTVEIQYYGKDAPLTKLAPTNFVLTNHPTLYLYGALAQAFLFVGDGEREADFRAKFIGALTGANKADKDGQYGPAPVMRVEGSTP